MVCLQTKGEVLGRLRGVSVKMLMHHSRNSEQKQWDETLVLALSGMGRLLRAHLPLLVPMQAFPQVLLLFYFGLSLEDLYMKQLDQVLFCVGLLTSSTRLTLTYLLHGLFVAFITIKRAGAWILSDIRFEYAGYCMASMWLLHGFWAAKPQEHVCQNL